MLRAAHSTLPHGGWRRRSRMAISAAGKTTSGGKTQGGKRGKTVGGRKKTTEEPSAWRSWLDRAGLHKKGRNPGQSTRPGARKPPPTPMDELLVRVAGDGTLLMGDLVMIAATEVSSERIPYGDMPILAGVSIASWLLAAFALGDYKEFPPTTDNWYLNLLGPVFLSVVDATLTWGVAIILSLAVFSMLISTDHMDAAPLLEDLTSENLSPQLEVAVATLITMSCWRGIAARLRSTR